MGPRRGADEGPVEVLTDQRPDPLPVRGVELFPRTADEQLGFPTDGHVALHLIAILASAAPAPALARAAPDAPAGRWAPARAGRLTPSSLPREGTG